MRKASRFGPWPVQAAPGLPALWLFTDPRNEMPLAELIGQLPRGAGLILRHWHEGEADLRGLARLCRRKGIKLLLSGDLRAALASGADGVHWPERLLRRTGRLPRPLLVTAAAHSPAALVRAARFGCDAAFLSPIFPTRSHASAAGIGPNRAGLWLRAARLPVLGLGGVHSANAQWLRKRGFAGLGAIDGWFRN